MKQTKNEKIRNLWTEEWKDIKFDDVIFGKEIFKTSNYGRRRILKKPSYTKPMENLRVDTFIS